MLGPPVVSGDGALTFLTVFSFHLARVHAAATLAHLWRGPTSEVVLGLRHAECMATMQLGSRILSRARMQLGSLALFAVWESDAAIDDFFAGARLGRTLAAGWHVRLRLIRRWGSVAALDEFAASADAMDADSPVVAVTLARLALPQVPRFIRWGKPVEELVRDHAGSALSLAALRPPRTVSTFTAWSSQRAMEDMVHGRGSGPRADRHAVAMAERRRKDFHHEFTTLRFRALAEHGEWDGRRRVMGVGDSGSGRGDASEPQMRAGQSESRSLAARAVETSVSVAP